MVAHARITAILTAIVALPLAAGCDAIGQDLSELGGALKPASPSDAARMAVDPTDPDKRREGITLLSNASFGGVEAYVTFYRDKVDSEQDPIVKAAAIQALARHGEPSDALRIAPHLTNPSEQVRWAAAKAMQRLHNPAVVPEMLKALALETENKDVRVALAEALGQYPEDRVFQGLVGALNTRDLAINKAAEQSLTTLTGMSFNMNAADWLTWYQHVADAGVAFAGQKQYTFPVYQRDIGWMERVAFWSRKTFEQPAPPVGLRPEGGRRTYDDDANAPPIPAAPGAVVSPPAATTQPATRRATYADDPED